MLFYNKYGKLIKINKLDFPNDKLYYDFIMNNKVHIKKEISNSNEYPIENILIKKLMS